MANYTEEQQVYHMALGICLGVTGFRMLPAEGIPAKRGCAVAGFRV